MHWVGAFSPQTVGGRRSHAPKAEKNFEKVINKKENRKAIRSAISATIDKAIVSERGHKIPENYPFIIDSSFEALNKTKEVQDLFAKLGFTEELERSIVRKIRAGIGKMRGRRYKRKKSILVVVSGECEVEKAVQNVPGVDVAQVNALNAELLAPGTAPGRITLWTEKAVEEMEKNNLFL
jgi:large subunit ribosomal protein L4e